MEPAEQDYVSNRYSGLDSINPANVKDLKVAWSFSTGVLRGHAPAAGDRQQRLRSTRHLLPNIVYALTSPRREPHQVEIHTETGSAGRAGRLLRHVNRGPASADGKIFQNQMDATTVALDAEMGKKLWKVSQGTFNRVRRSPPHRW